MDEQQAAEMQYLMDQQNQQQYYPPSPQPRSDKADLLSKIDPTKIVQIIKMALMGFEYSEDGEWKQIPELKELSLTKRGASEITTLMLAASSQNVSITRLDDETIRLRALGIAHQAMRQCLRNWKEYGIRGIDQLGYIHNIVFTNTLITLKQSEGGGIRDLIKGITSESIIHNTESDRRGIFRLGKK
jgi:hypothetical protein